jgi:hypothetical protein
MDPDGCEVLAGGVGNAKEEKGFMSAAAPAMRVAGLLSCAIAVEITPETAQIPHTIAIGPAINARCIHYLVVICIGRITPQIANTTA